MRELLRAKAKAEMKKRGLCRVNKKRRGGKSYFSMHWREYAAL